MKKYCFLVLMIVAVLGLVLLKSPPVVNKNHCSCSDEELCGCCYLTDVDVSKIAGRKFAVLVIEFEEGISKKDVIELKKSCKLVLAYINFGYAENWRDYWSKIKNEKWVHEPTEYEGEYFVEFWREEWLQVILAKAEKAYEMGFDGIYLDNIDACIVVSELDLSWAKNLNLTKLMVEAAYKLSALVKEKYGKSFKVYVNIGSAVELLTEEKFLASIDGVLREEVWYTIRNGKCVKVDPSETAYVLKYLREARLRDKTVIVADFLENKEMAEDFCRLCWYYGFIPVPQPVWASDYSEPPPLEWCDP